MLYVFTVPRSRWRTILKRFTKFPWGSFASKMFFWANTVGFPLLVVLEILGGSRNLNTLHLGVADLISHPVILAHVFTCTFNFHCCEAHRVCNSFKNFMNLHSHHTSWPVSTNQYSFARGCCLYRMTRSHGGWTIPDAGCIHPAGYHLVSELYSLLKCQLLFSVCHPQNCCS